tara:strand:+ start:3395 stop:5170 length:1776 start_codon:yes stop_codon:yes gene_type:complete
MALSYKFMALIWIFIFSIANVSLARSPRMLSPKVLPVHMSAKDCATWEELVTQSDGARRCQTKAHADIDPTCTEDLFDAVAAKQGCLLNLEGNNSCLALLSVSPIFAGVAGKYAGKAFAALVNKQPVAIQKKFNAAIEVINFEVSQKAKTREIWNDQRNEAVFEATKGKYKTMAGLNRAIRDADKRGDRNAYYELRELSVKSVQLLHKRVSKIIDSMPDSDLKLSLRSIQQSGSGAVAERIEKKLQQIFPNEYRTARSLLEARQKAISGAVEATGKPNGREHVERYNQEIDMYNERLFQLGMKNPRTALFLAFLKHGYSMTDPSSDVIRPLTEFVENKISEEKDARRVRTNRYQTRGVIAGGAFDVGVILAALVINKHEVKSCQSLFGFSQTELDFLGGSGSFSIQKAQKSTWKCESLGLSDPQAAYAQMEAHFGGVPKGICKMMKQQNQRMDQLLGDIDSYKPESCENTKDLAHIQSGPYAYKIPMDDVLNYPRLKMAKAYSDNGYDQKQSLKMQSFYLNIHRPGDVFDVRPDLVDLASECLPNSHNGNTFCEMREAFVKLRVDRSLCKDMLALAEEPVATPDRVNTPVK